MKGKMKKAAIYLQLVRPQQWHKNLVVFAGLIFSGHLAHLPLVVKAVQAFMVFCLAAGAIYIINDVKDRESDRQHPVKKQRPLAAGRITPGEAGWLAGLLLLASLAWGLFLTPFFAFTVAVYVLLNLSYTYGLKNYVIVDVFIITTGFVLRAAAGAMIISVPISSWLLVVTTLGALFLGFAKRRHELITMGDRAAAHRKSLGEYSPELLDQFMGVVASCTIIAYSLYAFTSQTASEYQYLMLTVPFVIYGILRYLYLVYQRNLGGTPELIFLQDKPLITAIVLWFLAVVFILQLG
ncbi:decaprenyl-phosphate phosphoribosyltransferase [candidate division FCPU426 bacterium]|nr:decaprenyl-phosphate phosphoribosyltransferase [candidate division FCPU426 bacterium]